MSCQPLGGWDINQMSGTHELHEVNIELVVLMSSALEPGRVEGESDYNVLSSKAKTERCPSS